MTKTKWSLVALVCIVGLTYILSICNASGIPHDSFAFTNRIIENTLGTTPPNIHWHHIAFFYTFSLWLKMGHFLQLPLQISTYLSLLNCLAGIASAITIYLILKNRFNWNLINAFFGTLVVSFSFGLWFYSSCLEVYLIGQCAMLLGLYLLTNTKTLSTKSHIALGFIHGIAIAFHIVNALFYFPIVYKFWKDRSKQPFFKALLLQGIIASCVGGIGYLIASGANLNYLLIHIMPKVEEGSRYGYSLLALSTWIKAFIGYSRAFIGGFFILSIPYIQSMAKTSLNTHFLVDNVYLVRNMPIWLAYFLCLMSGVFCIFFGYLCFKGFQGFKQSSPEEKQSFNVLLIGLIPFVLFITYFDPATEDLWIHQAICLWLLIFSVLKFKSYSKSTTLIALALLLFFINGAGSMLWSSQANNDYYALKTQFILKKTSTNDLIVAGRYHMYYEYFLSANYPKQVSKASVIPHFNSSPAVELSNVIFLNRVQTQKSSKPFFAPIEDKINTTLTRNGRVWVMDDAFDLEPGTKQLYNLSSATLDSYWTKNFNLSSIQTPVGEKLFYFSRRISPTATY